ncbi:ATP-grasp domain-containing protein [Carnobacteriaceae bacterium 52-44]
MVKNFNHQKTIGIVGSSPDAQSFILEANRLGFKTYHLCRTESEMNAWYGADKAFIGSFDDDTIRDEFLMQCDLLVYFDYSLNATQIEEARKSVVIPQGDDLLSFARDLVLQKAFKESLSVNIAPYETVVTQEDIKEGLRSIGYPAVLRRNYLNPDHNNQSFFIYEEEDIQKASKLLKYGTCVLESWIVTDDELSISVVKTASGAIKTFPVVKKSYRNDRLSNVQVPVRIDQDIIDEIERVARLIADNIQFIGAVSIDFVVSPAQALYVGNIYPFPNILSRYSEKNKTLSVVESHLRAIASLPLPEEIKDEGTYVFAPFYMDQAETINKLITIYPNWKFVFYPIVKKEELDTKEAVGHIIIETTDVQKTLSLLKNNEL